tara:strand:- start:566 stop:1228 length:663 start_codon:yes stop_codon:yes gene_type:complete
MKYAIKIHKISTVDELPDAWNVPDYKQLLIRFDLPDTESSDILELQELLFMAIAEFEPNEAAAILLDYKLSEFLSKGQIDQLSHEMLSDRISEEYPKIELHKDLFLINQLLYKAYNGKFLNTEATIIEFDITALGNSDKNITKEIALKSFVKNLDSHNIIIRLFGDQLNAIEAFKEANDIIWDLQKEENSYKIITSDYWMGKTEFLAGEFEANIVFFDQQ